jgi:hypothetical protein
LYFHIDKSIFGFSSEVLMVHYTIWEKVKGHSHVLIPIKQGFEVHIPNVRSSESGIWGADDAVPHDL